MIVVAGHARFGQDKKPVHGTGSEIDPFLKKRGEAHILVRHSLFPGVSSRVLSFSKGEFNERFCGFKNLPLLLRTIQEQLVNFYLIFKTRGRVDLFIGIDPLNAFSGLVAQKLGKIKRVVFYTADYAHQRFENPVMNWIYHCFDRFGIRNADQVWNVSTRIVEQRRKQGVPSKKNFLVPNSTAFEKAKRLPYSEINKHDLIIVSHLTKAIGFPLIFEAVKNLSKKYEDLRLLVIGGGPDEKGLKKLVAELGMANRIIFLGRMPHEKVLDKLSQSAVGLALYTGGEAWTEFGDSMKAREYMACGLPVIMTDIPSTADDVEKNKAGLVIDFEREALEEAIDFLFSSTEDYLKLRENAIQLAQKHDIVKILDQRMTNEN